MAKKKDETSIEKLVAERDSWKQEYNLTVAANKQLAEALEKLQQERDLLELMLFAAVRNSGVLEIGVKLNKTEEEISEKTFETIDAIKKIINVPKMTEIMNRATRRRKGDNNEKQ